MKPSLGTLSAAMFLIALAVAPTVARAATPVGAFQRDLRTMVVMSDGDVFESHYVTSDGTLVQSPWVPAGNLFDVAGVGRADVVGLGNCGTVVTPNGDYFEVWLAPQLTSTRRGNIFAEAGQPAIGSTFSTIGIACAANIWEVYAATTDGRTFSLGLNGGPWRYRGELPIGATEGAMHSWGALKVSGGK